MKKSYGKGIRLAAWGLATAMVLSLAAPAFAGEKPAAQKPAAGGAGLMAAINPATGKLRQPTAAERATLAAGVQAMMKSTDKLPLKQFADGTKSVVLGDSFLDISLAQVGADGTIQQICVDNPAEANAAIFSNAPAYEDK